MPQPANRPSATVAVLTSSNKRHRRDLLERLAAELEPHDNLVLVGTGHDPASPLSWYECRTRGKLERPKRPLTTRGLVLVVEEALLPATGLLSTLLSAMSDPAVDAAAPRSNVADGDDLAVAPPYRPQDPAARTAALAGWAGSHPAGCTPVRLLGGPCVVLRRHLLDELGGLASLRRSPVAPSIDARQQNGTLVVVENAYVHHLGGRPHPHRRPSWPVVSACIITKDEEHDLPTCLSSVTGIADEIVVYDTGSTDRTVALARELGAEVVEGDWDGDFARARNAALAHCRGQWILWLDADEAFVCEDPSALQARLAAVPVEVEGFLVLIDNLQGTEAATVLTHPAVRVFRRGACHWEGGLHEQVHRRFDGGLPHVLPLEVGRILHRGYLQKALSERDKGQRNLHSAFADLAGGSDLGLELRLLSLGRSYLLAGAPEEGVELCQRALDIAEQPSTRRLALRALSDGYSALGRHEEVLEIAEEIRAIAAVPILADLIEGRERLNQGKPMEALACFEHLDGVVVDDDGFEYRPSLVAASRADALMALDRPSEAADVLLATLREAGGLDTHLGTLVEAIDAAGRDLGEIYSALPDGRALAFVPQLLQMQPSAADRVLEAWHARDEASLPILAAAGSVALRLPIDRQLVWSARLRTRGLALSCPLVASTTLPIGASERVLASAVAWTSFADERARQAFGASVLSLAADERDTVRAQLTAISPALLPVFDALLPLERQAVAPVDRTGPAVLVISAVPCDLGAEARAAELALHGYSPILLQPHPIASVDTLLAERGVRVDGWLDPGDERWIEFASALAVEHYATTPLVGVIVMHGAEALLEPLRRLLPGKPVVLEGPDAGATGLLHAYLGSAPVPDQQVRAGICVALDHRSPHGVAGEEILRGLLEPLAEHFPSIAIALCGDDPGRRISSNHPALLPVGPSADPTPWIRSARALVVLATSDDAGWIELGEASGTPSFLVSSTAAIDDTLADLATVLTSQTRDRAHPRCAAEVRRPWTTEMRFEALLQQMTPVHTVRPRGTRPHGRRPTVLFRGPLEGEGTAATTNAALTRALQQRGMPFDLVLEPASNAALHDIELRHHETPDLSPSAADRLVVLLGAPHGGVLPRSWVGSLRDHVDDLWVTTNAARDVAEESGIDPAHLLALGVGTDLTLFRPDGPKWPIRTTKRRKFLFVGQANQELGFDALLEAYLGRFSATDDVCLVVHLEAGGSAHLEADVRRAASGPGPEIELVEPPLASADRAALYRACDLFVHPARVHACCLRPAEALASGLGVISTSGGLLDRAAEPFARLLETRPVPAPAVDGIASQGATHAEPSRADLSAALEEEAADLARTRRRGSLARRFARDALSWERVTDRAISRLAAHLEQMASRDRTRQAAS